MKRLFHLIAPALCLAALPAPAQDDSSRGSAHAEAYAEAAASIDADLRAALEELSELRDRIAEEKPEIAKESNRIAAEVREKRRRAEIARTSRDAAEAEFEKAENDLDKWREERRYLESLFLEFRNTYEASQSLAKIEADQSTLGDASVEGRLALVEHSLDQLANAGRVERVPGEAVGPDGVLVAGTFAEAGPVGWFRSEDGRISGLVSDGDDLRSALVPGTADDETVDRLLRGEPATPRFDPTLGTAVALTESDDSLIAHLEQGGFWIYPILALAAMALIAAALKWIQLVRIRPFPSSKVENVIDAVNRLRPDAARETTATIRHPARDVLESGIDLTERRGGPPSGELTRDQLEEALYEKCLEAQPPLQRGLALIAIASATAPLLGLLGTVTGMIETFRLINIFGTGDAKSLASGISEALVTTEAGLVVAIPALILHALLSRKVQGIRTTMEMTSLAFLNGIEPEPLGGSSDSDESSGSDREAKAESNTKS